MHSGPATATGRYGLFRNRRSRLRTRTFVLSYRGWLATANLNLMYDGVYIKRIWLGGVGKIRSCVKAWQKEWTIAHHVANVCDSVNEQCLNQPEHFIR